MNVCGAVPTVYCTSFIGQGNSCKLSCWDFEPLWISTWSSLYFSEALPSHVQLHSSRSRWSFSPGRRCDLRGGTHRCRMDVRIQPAHRTARLAARQLCPTCVKQIHPSDRQQVKLNISKKSVSNFIFFFKKGPSESNSTILNKISWLD